MWIFKRKDILDLDQDCIGSELDSTDKRNEMISLLQPWNHCRRRKKKPTTLGVDVVLSTLSQTRKLLLLSLEEKLLV